MEARNDLDTMELVQTQLILDIISILMADPELADYQQNAAIRAIVRAFFKL